MSFFSVNVSFHILGTMMDQKNAMKLNPGGCMGDLPHNWTIGFNLQAWLNFTVAWGDQKISHGTKTHIFDKFEAFCIQWYHFQLKIPIRNMFNLFFLNK